MHEETVVRLHDLLLRVARGEARRRRGQLSIGGPELDDLAHQAAADAVLAVVAKVGQFRGDSRFTTWACKFAIYQVSTKIGRHFWQRPTATIDGELLDRYVERQLAHGDAAALYPEIDAHLAACNPCLQDFEALLAAISGGPTAGSPGSGGKAR